MTRFRNKFFLKFKDSTEDWAAILVKGYLVFS